MSGRWFVRTIIAGAAVLSLGSCQYVTVGEGYDLSGRTVIEWNREDGFIYRRTATTPLAYKPSFMTTEIVPEDFYTDGGSVPRIFWSIPGLSPWGLGPAYIIHDWIFAAHRCKWEDVPDEIKNMDFEHSAQALAEVASALIDKGLIDHDLREQVIGAVNSRTARAIWDEEPGVGACDRPTGGIGAKRPGVQTVRVVDLEIPE